MMQKIAVMTCSDGRRDNAAVERFCAFAARMKERLPDLDVENGFLEFANSVTRYDLDT